MEAEIKAAGHPIFYGYEAARTPVRYANGPLLEVPRRFRDDWVLMSYSDEVLSGHLRGADQIDGKPAIVDVPRGDGRVVLFATNPCYRWQNHGEFGMLFNTILHYNDLTAGRTAPKATERTAEPETTHGAYRLMPRYRRLASSSRAFARAISRSASAIAPSSQTSHS